MDSPLLDCGLTLLEQARRVKSVLEESKEGPAAQGKANCALCSCSCCRVFLSPDPGSWSREARNRTGGNTHQHTSKRSVSHLQAVSKHNNRSHRHHVQTRCGSIVYQLTFPVREYDRCEELKGGQCEPAFVTDGASVICEMHSALKKDRTREIVARVGNLEHLLASISRGA